MTIQPKISIIVPVYNTEKYLSQCLESLLKQTLTEIEIICIDDGSTDGSGKILEEYRQKDARIIVMRQQNAGQSTARNKGIKIAKGEYVYFVDSDDWLENDCCQILYERAEANGLDMISMAATSDKEESGEYISEPFYNFYWLDNMEDFSVLPREEYLKHWWQIAPSAALTAYRRAFLLQNNLLFMEGLKYEDCLFFKQALFATDKFGVCRRPLYFHRGHAESTVNNGGRHYLDWFTINAKINELLEKNDILQKQRDIWLFSTGNYSFKLWNGIKKEFRREYFEKAHAFYTTHSPSTGWVISSRVLRKFMYSLLIAKSYFAFRLLYFLPKKASKKHVSIRIFGVKLKYKKEK